MEFESGVVGNFLVTSVGPQGEIPQVEIIGTEGVLYCGDPNMYHGPIGLLREGAWNNPTYEIPLMFPFSAVSYTHLPSYLEACRPKGPVKNNRALKRYKKELPRVQGQPLFLSLIHI